MIRRLILFLVLGGLLCGCASATTLEVGEGYTYSTVNGALTAAVSGDTILIHPGTYLEKITIQNIHDLTIQGDGYPTVQFSDPSLDSYPVFLIGSNAYNITIKGLHIVNTGDYVLYSGGIRSHIPTVHGLYIEDNIIETDTGDGIWLQPIPAVPTMSSVFNDCRIINNTVSTLRDGRGICLYIYPVNLTVAYNDITTSKSWDYMTDTVKTAYGLKLQNDYYNTIPYHARNVKINNNVVHSCSYSLVCCYGENITVENNTAYGKATHNCYELGYRGGIFRNNTLIDTNRTWAYANSGRSVSLNNFYNPGGNDNYHMVIDAVNVVNSTEGRMFSIGGHQRHVLMKNTTIDTPNHPATKIIIYGFSGGAVSSRTSDGLIIDNVTILNHSSATTQPIFIQGAGTDLTPTSHPVGHYADLLRDTITIYDTKILENLYSYDFGINADSADTNVSVIMANSNLSTGFIINAGGGVIHSLEHYYFTDIDVTDGGEPAGTSRVFVESNTTRLKYNEPVPYFTGNYIDETQDNYTYQQTAKGRLDSPEYIETLENGQTGTRSTPHNCLLLASETRGLSTPTASGSEVVTDVSYNLTVSGGAFDSPYLYTTQHGTSDIVTVDSSGNYAHKYGTKTGAVIGFHPSDSMYKTNSYERGTVDLTIPITEYEKTVIPMGMTM